MSLANFRAAKCHQLRSCGEVQVCSAAARQAFPCRCGRRITQEDKIELIFLALVHVHSGKGTAHE